MTISIEDMATFCKKKGIVFRTSDIYGGLSGFFDFGPLGVEIKNNVKHALWKRFVRDRPDVYGIDGAIISHPRVWEASGHVGSFSDLMLTCSKTGKKIRADTFIEDELGINVEGKNIDEIQKIIDDNKLVHPESKAPFKSVTKFNLMFTTEVGAGETSVQSYLRPETAQLIFSNFRQVVDSSRVKLPFGIAQIGKAFRNEISPRDFLFRSREFEQFEIEFFINPKYPECPLFDEVKDIKVNIISANDYEAGKKHITKTVGECLKEKLIRTEWMGYWLGQYYKFFTDYGINPSNLRIREHHKEELAHYATACYDIEYRFPFGWKEIHGDADRGTFDLSQHAEFSKQDMSLFIEEDKEKVVPHVAAEPSQGIERAMLAFIFDAFDDDKERGNVVLHLDPRLAPIKVAVFPLVNKLNDSATALFDSIRTIVPAVYDKGGSVGRRYARADEQGIPYCITVDFEDEKTVTIRDRESTKQKRIPLDGLGELLMGLSSGLRAFEDL